MSQDRRKIRVLASQDRRKIRVLASQDRRKVASSRSSTPKDLRFPSNDSLAVKGVDSFLISISRFRVEI